MSDAPRLISTDQLTSRNKHAVLFDRVKPRSLATLLRDAVQRMNGVGGDAEAQYQQALAALRLAGSDALDVLGKEFRGTDEEDFVNRWAIVQLLSDLHDQRAIRLLDRIVGLPLPKDRSPDPHGSTAARELVVRTAAVEGIARLAASGSSEAQDALFNYVSHPVRSVRIAAVMACVEQGGAPAREALQRRLAESDHWMMDIRRVHPREVPPIQGHRFLPPKSPPEGSVVPRPLTGRSTSVTSPSGSSNPSAAKTSSAAPSPRGRTADSPSKRPHASKKRKG
jgi:hypothetical protein